MTESTPDVLVDSSAAVALTVRDHEFHDRVVGALDGHVLGLSGHAAFETFSVLTRLPAPRRRAPAVVADVLAQNFPESRYLGADVARDLAADLVRLGISGGKVFDALVGACAFEHGAPLATLDDRASATYRTLGVIVLPI